PDETLNGLGRRFVVRKALFAVGFTSALATSSAWAYPIDVPYVQTFDDGGECERARYVTGGSTCTIERGLGWDGGSVVKLVPGAEQYQLYWGLSYELNEPVEAL